MKFYLDTEFLEYKKQPKVLGIPVGKPIDTIELISIGIISEDVDDRNNPQFSQHYEDIGVAMMPTGKVSFGKTNKEYYAICKDFDVKAAWDNEWLRENVLKSILKELWKKDELTSKLITSDNEFEEIWEESPKACRGWLKMLLNKYGKTREQIASEIVKFTNGFSIEKLDVNPPVGVNHERWIKNNAPIEFYAYYADYDWVVFCWLFGRMIDLPKGFPMYCKDLKQILDEKQKFWISIGDTERLKICTNHKLHSVEVDLKQLSNYPKQTNNHNSLSDAKWDKELHKFIDRL